MKNAALALIALLAAGCASFDGRGLAPGTPESQVDALMGPAADKRMKNGETWLYYPRQPYGKATYVARIGSDGRLIAIEQRLTDENVARIERDKWRTGDVRDLFGPPYTAVNFARMQRDIWEYRFLSERSIVPYALYVQFSPDGVVREVYTMSDPDYRLSDCCGPN